MAQAWDWCKRHWQIVVIAGYLSIVGFMWWYIDPSDDQQRNEFFRTAAQLAGGVFLGIGLVYTHRTVKNSQDSLKHQQKSTKDQRFFDASKLLFEDGNPASHIGALYTLEALSKESEESEDYYDRVIEVICAFVRARSEEDRPSREDYAAFHHSLFNARIRAEARNNKEDRKPEDRAQLRDFMDFPKAAHDIEVAMLILARREKSWGRGEERGLDLRGAHLSGLEFAKADFAGAAFRDAVAINTVFINCEMTQTSFFDSKADLRFSVFRHTSLNGSWFAKADVRSAKFNYDRFGMGRDASDLLNGTFWSQAKMEGAEFWCDSMEGMRGITREQYDSLIVHTPNHVPPTFDDTDHESWHPNNMDKPSSRKEDNDND